MTITTYPHPTCGTGYRLAYPSGRCAARVWRLYGLTGPQVGAWAWEGGRFVWRDDAEPWICSRCPATAPGHECRHVRAVQAWLKEEDEWATSHIMHCS